MSFCDPPTTESSRQEAVNIFECGDVMCDVFGLLADCPASQHEWRRTSRAAAKWYDIAAGSYRLFPFFAISPAAEMKAASASAKSQSGKGSGKCSSTCDRGKLTCTFDENGNNHDDDDDDDGNVHTYHHSRDANRQANKQFNNKNNSFENTIISELHEGAEGMIRRLTEQFELELDAQQEAEKRKGGRERDERRVDEKKKTAESETVHAGELTADYGAESCGDTVKYLGVNGEGGGCKYQSVPSTATFLKRSDGERKRGAKEEEEEKKDLFWRFCPVSIARSARKKDSVSSSDDDAFEYRVGGMLRDSVGHIYSEPNNSTDKTSRSYDALVVPTLIINLPFLSELARKCPPESQEPPATKRNEELRKLFFEARRRGDVCGLYHVPKANCVARPLSVTDILGLLPPKLKRKRAVTCTMKNRNGEEREQPPTPHSATDHDRDSEEISGNLGHQEMAGGDEGNCSTSSDDDDEDDVFDPSKYGMRDGATNNTDNTSSSSSSSSSLKEQQQECHHDHININNHIFEDDYDQLLWFKKGFLRGINARSVYFIGGERVGKCGAVFLSASPELEHIHKMGDWRNVTDLGKGFLSHCPRLRRVEFHQLSKLMSLRDETLAHCPSLRSVTFPKSVTDIGDDFLRGCGALRSFDLADAHDLYSIGHGFLSRCSSLLKVTIRGVPKLESIGKDCLFGATSLRRLVLDTVPTQRTSLATTEDQQNGDMGLKKDSENREPYSSSLTSSSSSADDDPDEDPSLPSPTDPSPLLTIDEGLLKGCPQLLDTNRRQRARELGILSRWGGAGWGAEVEQSREEEEGRLLFCTTNIYLAPAENRYVRSSGAVRTIYLKRPPSRSSKRARGGKSRSSSHLRRVSHEELTGRRVTVEEETAGCVIC